MYKIGIIGDRETTLGFKAVGLTTFPCGDPEEAKKIIRRIAKEDFAIIYITEKLYLGLEKTVDEYRDTRLPAIIVIPGREGNLGVGLNNVKKSVERAVGADILFGGEK